MNWNDLRLIIAAMVVRFHSYNLIENHISQIAITTEENLFQGRNMTKEFANAYHTSWDAPTVTIRSSLWNDQPIVNVTQQIYFEPTLPGPCYPRQN